MNTTTRNTSTLRPRTGQVVEFHCNHPSLPAGGAVIRGVVRDYNEFSVYPSNPSVDTYLGGIQLLASWWGNEVKVIA